ncbi:hypothetical protein ACFW6K_00725 [Streptomyces sp. NPDC058733]|uniref:hypothetical protein n=1 Tax=unclassified Streptomyces TaxID=2593676 RepID=UPI003646F882
MTNGTCPAGDRTPATKMTIRVYQVARDGTVTHDRGTVVVPPTDDLLPLTTAYPPCGCGACRGTGKAAIR